MVESRIKKANKILRIIIISLISLVALIGMVFGGLTLAGYKIVRVVGDSSTQSIEPFSLVLVKSCKVEELKARENGKMGDFAMRYFGSGYVTHEVVKVEQNEEGEWVFDTQQVGDRTTQSDSQIQNNSELFDQSDLVGKVVAQETFIGKLLAWIQGYPSLETSLTPGPFKDLAAVRILTLAVILYGITKFSDFMYYKEELY